MEILLRRQITLVTRTASRTVSLCRVLLCIGMTNKLSRYPSKAQLEPSGNTVRQPRPPRSSKLLSAVFSNRSGSSASRQILSSQLASFRTTRPVRRNGISRLHPAPSQLKPRSRLLSPILLPKNMPTNSYEPLARCLRCLKSTAIRTQPSGMTFALRKRSSISQTQISAQRG